ncbi:hypothetical protein [Achromobacter sp. UMC46]|uniref:hypothetical protein n=1 Tax=Achromobacter sp. UMC46 TaxID=1862319 RepID=UPI0016015861|nr:hypothetical protein [Achromobacter sp. UMC46]MBB1595863.1 hypothetical protein [Achromobacter sp. UMC46]
MAICSECENIVPDTRGAPGHAGLVSLGPVRSLEAVSRKAAHEAFVCVVCDTGWDHLDDKGDPTAGWKRC